METGIIKSYWPRRGFGFIIPDDGRQDVFMHVSAFQDNPNSDLEILQLPELAGLRVRFEAKPRNLAGARRGEIATVVKWENRNARS
jgi:cold shock CspA family protein